MYQNQNVLNLDSFLNQCQNQQFLNIVDQSIVYKQNEYDAEFNVSFCYLVPNKISSLIKFQSLEKLKIVFLNYENPEQIQQIFLNQQNNIKNFLEKVDKKEIVVDKNLIDKKILESFLKCRDPISMIQGQIRQKEKLLENYPLKQNIELIQNFEILANLAQKTCQQNQDNFYNNQNLQNLANYIVNQKLETKLVSTSIVNCFLVMSVPCSGKSTLAKKFKELRKDKENIYSGSISTDQIVSIAMEKIKNEKNNDLNQNLEEQDNKSNKSNKVFQNLKNEQQKKDNMGEEDINLENEDDDQDDDEIQAKIQKIQQEDNQIYYQALQEVRGYFGWFLAGHFKKIYNQPKNLNIIFQDKNVVPPIFKDTVFQTITARTKQEINPLIRNIYVICPKIFNKENKMKNFPFSYQFVIQCMKRVLVRKNHETLEGKNEYKIAVIIRFVQAFHGLQNFTENEFKKTFQEASQYITKIIQYPFITEEAENQIINQDTKEILISLLEVEKQQESQYISELPQTKLLMQNIQQYQLIQFDELIQQQSFDELIQNIK